MPAFFEPNAHWSTGPPSPPSANQGPRRARRKLRLGGGGAVLPHPGMIGLHTRLVNFSVSLKSPTTRGRKARSLGSIPPPRCGNSSRTGRSLIGQGSNLKPKGFPGTARSVLWNGEDPRAGRGSQGIRRPFPPEVAPTLKSKVKISTLISR